MIKKHKDKLNKLLNKLKKPYSLSSSFIRYKKGTRDISTVFCKKCRTVIREYIKNPKGGGLLTYSCYKEVEIKFKDKSNHFTCVCKSCYKTLNVEDLWAFYVLDMKQWACEIGSDNLDWEYLLNREIAR